MPLPLILVLCISASVFSSVQSRKCFQCSCDFDSNTNTGSCSSPTFLSSCTLVEVQDKYCTITRTFDNNNNREQRIFSSVESNRFHDPHFIQAIETISLLNTSWVTRLNMIMYGCDWDGCNEISLSEFLPESFQMRIDSNILFSQLVGNQSSNRTCYHCNKCINDLTVILCEIVPCNSGACYIDELHNYVTTPQSNCTYNFYSICSSFAGSVPSPNVRIRATYFIDLPENKRLEINEVDMYCLKDNCNSITIVEGLKERIQTNITLASGFQPSRPTTDRSTTQLASDTSTTTGMSPTSLSQTTSSSSVSIRQICRCLWLLLLVPFLL